MDEDQVSVAISNGVVTLSGNVETWGERRSARDNAHEGGAKEVANKLTANYRHYGPDDHRR